MRSHPAVIAIGLLLSARAPGTVTGESQGGSHPFAAEWKVTENGVTRPMQCSSADGTTTWVMALPSGGEKTFWAEGNLEGTQYDCLTFQVRLPDDDDHKADTSYELIAHFKDVDFWWYQKLLPYVLRPGAATEIVVPLSNDSDSLNDKHRWVSVGHMKPFTKSCLRKVREIGITVFPSRSSENAEGSGTPLPIGESGQSTGSMQVSDFRAVMHNSHNGLRIVDWEAPSSVGRYQRFEIGFQLTKEYQNPFDPDEINITAEFVDPTGRTSEVNGFWFQDYRRTSEGRLENLCPVGEPLWKVRFAPIEVGEYTYRLRIKDRQNSLVTDPRTLTVLQSDDDGFLRVSSKDHRYFEFDSGRFYWPITLNLHCTYDSRYVRMVRNGEIPIEDRRSYFYEDRFRKMADAGMNGTEIWIASWGFEIEWRGDWIGWAGLGHYSLQNAWRLDHVLRLAEKLGIHVNFVMSCHGAYCFGTDNPFADDEWQNSPFYVGNGGWMKADNVKAMFTDDRVFKAIENRARYLIARYSHSPAIWCYEIISESDLTPWRISDTQRRFIWKYAHYIKDIDPYQHPVTNHYCGSYTNYDPVMFRNPVMDLSSGDAYRGGINRSNVVSYPSFPKHLAAAAEHLAQFKKPAVANECGGTWSAGPLCLLESDVHALNWAAFMTHLGGTPQTWWEDAVDENNWYEHYAAFAKYQRGEDKRAADLKTHDEEVFGEDGTPIPDLYALSLRSKKLAYVWVYDDREFRYDSVRLTDRNQAYYRAFHMPKRNLIRDIVDAKCLIPDLEPGRYAVEVWDTYKGEIVDITELDATDEGLRVSLPEFRKDIALKVKQILY